METNFSKSHEEMQLERIGTVAEPKGWWHKEVEELKQQLADSHKQIVLLREFVKLLRDYIPASAIGNMTVQEALAATADLENVRLCEKEPAAIVYLDYGGDGAVLQTKLADDEPLYRAREPK